jgi:hypothetical protein
MNTGSNLCHRFGFDPQHTHSHWQKGLRFFSLFFFSFCSLALAQQPLSSQIQPKFLQAMEGLFMS